MQGWMRPMKHLRVPAESHGASGCVRWLTFCFSRRFCPGERLAALAPAAAALRSLRPWRLFACSGRLPSLAHALRSHLRCRMQPQMQPRVPCAGGCSNRMHRRAPCSALRSTEALAAVSRNAGQNGSTEWPEAATSQRIASKRCQREAGKKKTSRKKTIRSKKPVSHRRASERYFAA